MSTNNIWGPIEISRWEDTPCFVGRIACEEDVKKGLATFYVQSANEHHAINIDLPALGLLSDEDTGERVKVIVIQAERADHRELLGYRMFEGGNGICLFNEVEFIQ